MKQIAKIRFLGSDWWQGSPRQRKITVGHDTFWNHCKFQEQDADGAYIRPIEFYKKYKDLLDDTKLFQIEILEINEDMTEEIPKVRLECPYCGKILIAPETDEKTWDYNPQKVLSMHIGRFHADKMKEYKATQEANKEKESKEPGE